MQLRNQILPRDLRRYSVGQFLTLFGGAAAGFSPEALSYFSRLDAAGDTAYIPYKQAHANYIDGLIAAGMWDGLLTAASFVGVGLQGCSVPLRADMAVLTLNNFVGADLNVLTGLKGDGASKDIDTNENTTSFTTDDHSLSVLLSDSRDSGTGRYISGASSNLTLLGNPTSGFRARCASSSIATLGTSTATNALIGISRDNSANCNWRYGTSGVQVGASTGITASPIRVFSDGINRTAARLACYQAGDALDLEALEVLQQTLIAEIGTV